MLSSHEFDDLGNLRSHGSRRNIFSFGVINTEIFYHAYSHRIEKVPHEIVLISLLLLKITWERNGLF